MAKIALRVYNNEINDLIDHGQIDEAVAHCRHILETFPKHVDTYRLLGKAYLEEQRYGDAADILQRVLSSIPEDFISQVGMSIIREDEGNLDTAIFHMERAFEVQPSNHAIQDELKRLYGRRDGIEPPKIRLTRGALARMYAHGNLHELAIAELLAALSEDPKRYELMVLLAKMYYQADKKVEAAETCAKILEKLPYCLDANRLLVNILESNDREENAKGYRSRWEELDPYAAALDKGELNTEYVPNQTVTVDRLDWEPEGYKDDTYGRPAWASSLGVNLQGDAGEGGALPDWMNERQEGIEPADSLFGGPTEERELPPLWESPPDEEPEPVHNLGFTPEPTGFEDTFPVSEKPPEDSLFPSEDEEEETPEWLRTPAEESPEPSDGYETEGTPDWMQTPADSVEPQEEGLLPSGGAEGSTPEQPGPATDETEAIPDFLREAGWEPSSGEEERPTPSFGKGLSREEEDKIAEGEIPAWMRDFAPPEEVVPDSQPTIVGDKSADTPAWLSQVESQEEEEGKPPPTIPEPADEDEGLAWLENLAVKPGVAEEELVTSPEERGETPPEWLQTIPSNVESQPEGEEDISMEWLDQLSKEAAEEAASTQQAESQRMDELPDFLQPEELEFQPEIEEIPPTAEIPVKTPASSTEEDEGLGWLESLAAKQGVAEEELVTSPEERSETPPEWLQTPPTDVEPQPEGEEEPSMEWLDQLSEEAAKEAAPLPLYEDKPVETEDWLDSLGQFDEEPAAPVSETGEVEETSKTEKEEEGLAWLESLAAKQGVAEEELVTSPEERSEIMPAWLQETPGEGKVQLEGQEEPSLEWLDHLSLEPDEKIPPLPLSEDKSNEEVEDWLNNLRQPGEVSAEQGVEEGVRTQFETDADFSMEWLDQLSQEAAKESSPSVKPADESDEETEAWLRSFNQPKLDSETYVSKPAEEEADEGLAWLENLTEKGTSEEDEPPDWILPEKKEPAEETLEDGLSLEWLAEMGQDSLSGGDEEKEVKMSTDWLTEISEMEDDLETEEELGSTPEAIDKVDEWIQSLEQTKTGKGKIEPEVESLPFEPAPESDTPMVPEWLQDVAEQKPEPDAIEKPPEWLPEVEEPVLEVEEVTRTQPGEWQPESVVNIQPVEEETKPTPTPTPKKTPDMLAEARQAMHEHKIDKAIDVYAKLIKRGKVIEETIEDIREALRRHPINPALWQVLGDALMRSDRLQEALDAYSKAEDLLR